MGVDMSHAKIVKEWVCDQTFRFPATGPVRPMAVLFLGNLLCLCWATWRVRMLRLMAPFEEEPTPISSETVATSKSYRPA